MLIYIDSKTGGASTSIYSGIQHTFPVNFLADYCVLIENSGNYTLREYSESWSIKSTPLLYYASSFTELRVTRSSVDSPSVIRVISVVENETKCGAFGTFPVENPTSFTSGVSLTHYYEWTNLGSGITPNNDYTFSEFTDILLIFTGSIFIILRVFNKKKVT